MQREAIVRILRETGDLLEIQQANPFRVRAYHNAARAMEGLSGEPQEMLEGGSLAEVPGIGAGLVAAIAEILQTGRLTLHDELRRQYPPGLLDLFRVPGLGAKRIGILHRELGVGSPGELERAAREGRVAALAGFGVRSQEKILAGLEALGRYGERHLVDRARDEASRVLEHLRRHPAVQRAEIAGSLRRWCETIGDLDFVAAVAGKRRSEVAAHFAAVPGCEEVVASGETKVALRLAGGFEADLRMVEGDEFASALHHFTGGKEHNIALRTRARLDGLTVNEYGVFHGEKRLDCPDEAAIYRRLGLAFIEPEMREGLDEIERAAAGPLPALVETGDLRGTFHVHTTWSDGTASIEAMARAAAALGWEYLGLADHSRSAAYAGGMSAEQVREQWAEVDAWNARGEAPWLFKGIESDILVDGQLDYPDDLLLGFDFVVASVHSRFRLPREEMTARIVRAVRHPCTTFLGHPTGRLLLAREGYEVDLDEVLDAAEEAGVIVELNANPHRLDLDWRILRSRLPRGTRTAIHPDAHSPQGLEDVLWGVHAARKAGARAADVLNCEPLSRIREHFEHRRSRARRLLAGER